MNPSDVPSPVFPCYPQPAAMLLRLGAAALLARTRSFHHDAATLIARLDPPLQVHGRENIPSSGPCLLTANHYSRLGFDAWWVTLAVGAVVPVEVHWTMTAGWTFPGRWYRAMLKPVTEWAFGRVARVYGFTSMPPMPPDPAEVQARTRAVRQVLAYVRRTPQPVAGLVPEGRDFPGGILGRPPPGAGRFILQLVRLGLEIVPVGVYEEGGALCVSFGPRYRPDVSPGLPSGERDRAASRAVMEHIARQLPPRLRGEFGE